VEELRTILEHALNEDAHDAEADVLTWGPIEGEPCTFGVELVDGRTFFITVTEA
jgi:hypothetical protein